MNARFRVLMVVRDAAERGALTLLLQPDFELETPATAVEAAAALRTGRFEVLLSDFKLSGNTGAELAREATQLPDPPTCILLADSDEEVSAQDRASSYLLTVVTRPWNPARLVRLLEQSSRLTLVRRAADAIQKRRGR